MNMSIFRTGALALLAFACTETVHASERAIREGQWSFSARAGIAPTIFSEDAKISYTGVNITGGPVTVPSGNYSTPSNGNYYRQSYKYSWGDTYDLPFTAGGDIGYGVMDNFEVFFNFDYLYAGGDEHRIAPINFLGREFTTRREFKDYNSYGFYLGGRYYFDIDSFVSPFVGAKLGILSRSKSRLTEKVLTSGDPTLRQIRTPFYKSSTGFSGGLQLGFDYAITDAFSAVAMAEMIGSTSVKANKNTNFIHERPRAIRLYSRVYKAPKGTLSFPITLGIRARV